MYAAVQMVWVSVLVGALPTETKFVQVMPPAKEAAEFKRSAGEARAIVLIQGLAIHPFSNKNVPKAVFRDWQKMDSVLVKALAEEGDVFAFAYGQNVAVEEIAALPCLGENVSRLKKLGYRDIVLVGHSAGGLIARHFVEDYPEAGVTKVIQICTPNGGSSLGNLKSAVRESQEVFVESLSKKSRELCLKKRSDKAVPKQVEFVCLVGNGAKTGDGIVSCRCQWTEDLQKQGIPALAFSTDHFAMVRSKEGAQKIADLVREPYPRWDANEVADARKRIFKD